MSLPFIISTDRRKVDSETRKLIRSHVMRGKNRIKTRKKLLKSSHGVNPAELWLIASGQAWPSGIPRLLSSNFSAISFADNIEPALLADALLFSSMLSEAMFVLHQCITPKASGMTQAWFSPMLFDAAYVNVVCFTVQTYFDGIFKRTRSIEAQRRDCIHYAKAIRILQERLALDDDSARLSDSTIMTILALSGHAYTIGDYKSANYHINGLLKLVRMRGAGTFLQNTKLMIEIIRCDLIMALDSGSNPTLFSQSNIPWPLLFGSNLTTMTDGEPISQQLHGDNNTLVHKLNPELAVIWVSVLDFCAMINVVVENGGIKVTEDVFLHSMGSIMYRLLHYRFEPNSLDEAFRFGLLAFSSPIFLHWNRGELPDPRFTFAYREALARLKPADTNLKPREYQWLLMIAALSMAHEPDNIAWLRPWLQTNSGLCNVLAWDDMRDLLNSFPWIGIVYDNPGKDIFDSMLAI